MKLHLSHHSLPGLALLLALLLSGCVQPPVPGPAPQPTPAPTPTPGPTLPIPVPPIPPAVVSPHTPVTEKELMITDLRVVNSPRATDPSGPWHMRTLFANLAPNGVDPSQVMLRWLRSWESAQVVNGFTIPARPSLRKLVTEPWIAASGEAGNPDSVVRLDWSKAPFRLLAIVCRMDLAQIRPEGVQNAGEGRFVFGVLGAPDPTAGNPELFTIILEYGLQAANFGQVRDWAKSWHQLGNLGDFNDSYLATLELITDAYSGRNIAPNRQNGSALNQLRTDEIALGLLESPRMPWELREFRLLPGGSGFLQNDTVKQTPDLSLNNTPALAQFVQDNRVAILATNHIVPDRFPATQSFLGAASVNGTAPTLGQPVLWRVPGASPQERHLFAFATCSGCHGREVGVPNFLHIANRPLGEPAQLSGFLTGIQLNDPVEPTVQREFNDLAERQKILQQLATSTVTASSSDLIRELLMRRSRIH